jgi:hypothetical protein
LVCGGFSFVMPGFMPGIHVLAFMEDVDGRAFARRRASALRLLKASYGPQAGQAQP